VAEVGDSPPRWESRTGSAAAPCVAFPAERLAAARGFGNMTDYFGAGRGEPEVKEGGIIAAGGEAETELRSSPSHG